MSATVPEDASNLVLRAAALIKPLPQVGFHLHKTLPAAAGIGGGSSDAAATLRALATLTGATMPPLRKMTTLGADIPVCLVPKPQRMRGAGELLMSVSHLPEFALLLVNPGIPLPTGKVFSSLPRRNNPPMQAVLPRWADLQGFLDWLAAQRNDMEPAAKNLAPQVGAVLAALSAQQGCRLARMSGSGATCFGLFARLQEAEAAAIELARDTEWWVAAAPVSVT